MDSGSTLDSCVLPMGCAGSEAYQKAQVDVEELPMRALENVRADPTWDTYRREMSHLKRECSPTLVHAYQGMLEDYVRLYEENSALASQNRELMDVNETLRQENDSLRHDVRVDELTGLYRQNCLEDTLQQALANGQRQGKPLALLALDVDNFKEVNDTYGHDVGNEALAWLGERLRKVTRDADARIRTGGDEFNILVYGHGEAGAYRTAERIREELEANPFYFDSACARHGEASAAPSYLSVSIGVAEARPYERLTPQNLYKRADQALYAAKDAREKDASPLAAYSEGVSDTVVYSHNEPLSEVC